MNDPGEATARFRATVHYDGAAFHGSQLQPALRTVQGEIETALSSLLDRPVRIELAGRTDAGVHAAGQEIAFDAPARRDPDELRRGLDALAGEDIWIEGVRPAEDGFHPRFAATGRRYEYLVGVGPEARTPILRGRIWAAGPDLDFDALARLAGPIAGERSFEGFAKSGQPERGTRCAVETAGWRRTPTGLLSFEIVADRFLHHMVRYLVGTLVEAASGRRDPADVGLLLEAGEPSRAAYPAPPAGLYLTGVRYPDGWNRGPGVPGLSAALGGPA